MAGFEEGGQVNLPHALCEILMPDGGSGGPLILQIRNSRTQAVCCAGMREFTAPDGEVQIPRWMMTFLKVEEGETVEVSVPQLRTATSVIFQPLDESFEAVVQHQREIFETGLRTHPCLNQGSEIPIAFGSVIYRFFVLRTDPERIVSTVRADVIFDLAPVASRFKVDWNSPDTDSSDSEGPSGPAGIGRRVDGLRTVEIAAPPRERRSRSTFAKREELRMHPPLTVGTILGADGKAVKLEEPKAPPVSLFTGEGRSIKKDEQRKVKPGGGGRVDAMPAAEEKTGPVSSFTGESHILDGRAGSLSGAGGGGAGAEVKPSPFSGGGRRLDGPPSSSSPGSASASAAAPPKDERPKKDPPSRFQGPARSFV
jgi:hypothetical protein